MNVARLVPTTVGECTGALPAEFVASGRRVTIGLMTDFPIARATEERPEPDDVVETLDRLVEMSPAARPVGADVVMRDLRRRAATVLPRTSTREPWPPAYVDPFPDLERALPEVDSGQVSTAVVGGSVQHHGCLVVRGLFGPEKVDMMVDLIDNAIDNHDAGGRDPSGYSPVDTGVANDANLRRRTRNNGGVWLADSPRATSLVMHELTEAGVVGAMTEHFGTRPFFSLQKSTLRRVEPEARITAWHQDGSFLDDDVRTMNVWIALTDCGGSHPASGLEVVPTRMESILDVDREMGRAAVPFDVVDRIAEEIPVLRPEFTAGDALIFDERFLHRTHLDPGLTERRYALECWFFAPSHVTAAYEPFLV